MAVHTLIPTFQPAGEGKDNKGGEGYLALRFPSCHMTLPLATLCCQGTALQVTHSY